ncbi:T6SS effector BTH_I2691 family protein [Vibrio cholerae]|uniref:T6SS effector BTH_I2691 family protein n=1 Tax=Vibrio cholerae TaxID=666 RepID=UPI0029346C7B|nr:T6SS effector BTH_I2691 family protein [Vibrio cholerae]MDV2389369.1 T6SS effector BTH_I2691 family protein [Vibrio cholerae]
MSNPNQAAKTGQTNDAQNPASACPFKQPLIGIIPVRYAFDVYDDQGQALHPLPKADRQWKGQFSIKQRSYTLRQLRDGWLYVYDETAKTLHEYEVVGCKLTKIDWSDDEANKPTHERGSKGESKSCLLYPAQHTLSIGYAHQRWTWRVCEHMRSNTSSRHAVMRKVSLKQFESNGTHPHAHFAQYLEDYVADIGTPTEQDIFKDTCTPLLPGEKSEEAVNGTEFKFVADKAVVGSSDYLQDLPEQNCGLFVALNDPLADVSDLFVTFTTQVAKRAEAVGDETQQHKMQMAELTRTLGRIRLEEKEIPDFVKQDPIRILELERAITEYCATAKLAEIESYALASEGHSPSGNYAFMQQRAEQKLAELKTLYRFEPTSAQMRKWRKKDNSFIDEVRWADLDNFLVEHYTELKGLDEQIKQHYAQFMSAFNQLGLDPLLFGMDNQDEVQQAYLLALTSQFLVVVTQVNHDEKSLEILKKDLSFDSPKNLMALASTGFSLQANQAINNYIQGFSTAFLSTSSPSDMVAFATAIANWDTFTGDGRIQEKAWFKKWIEPVQSSFSALQKAVANQAKESWQAVMELLFPYQNQPKGGTPSLLANLRLLLVESLVREEAVLQHNPKYAAELKQFETKLNAILQEMNDALELKPGNVSPKNHQIATAQSAQRKLGQLLSSELPMMLTLKNQAVMNTFQQSVNEKLSALSKNVKTSSASVSQKLGGLGGLLFALNLWNTTAVLENIRYKVAQYPSWDPSKNPALGEAIYATGYTIVAAGAISAGRVWKTIASNQQLLESPLKRALQTTAGTTMQDALKTFSKSIALVATVGMIASALETWESWGKFNDSSKTDLERFGYLLKGGATVTQMAIFAVQLVLYGVSRFIGFGTIAAISAGWMAAGFAVIGIVYLIGVILTNVFKRSELEIWLSKSMWGKESAHWSMGKELTELERLLHRPSLRLSQVTQRKAAQWMDSGSLQWQLELTLPDYLKGQTIGLQITRLPAQPAYYQRQREAVTPILINEQQGKWSIEDNQPVYRITLGGSEKDTVGVCVSLPLHWVKEQSLKFCARGTRAGELDLQSAEANDIATRNLVVGKS